MAYKICVYAICKNEINHIDAWIQSMSEADYIVVLDTGSTDGTYEKLLNNNSIYQCEQKIISPWRFDVARNESMKLIPDDADILVCTDPDERFESGWADTLRNTWQVDTSRCFYNYVWSHNEDGSPKYNFAYDKIHCNHKYHWKCAVHEYLVRDDDDTETFAYESAHRLILTDKITLHHYQDISKPRASYLDLLKMRVQDDPNDAYGWWYLGREYADHLYSADSIVAYEKARDIFEKNSDKVDAFGMKVATYYNLAKYYYGLKQYDKSIQYCNDAILMCATHHREPYLLLAEIYSVTSQFNLVIGCVLECLKQCPTRTGHWIEEDINWQERPFDLLSVAYYNIGELDKAKEFVLKAHQLAPNDARITKNYNIIVKGEI